MSDDDPVADKLTSEVHELHLVLPTVHKGLVHKDQREVLDAGVSALICEYTGVSGAPPTMHNLYLAPNAHVEAHTDRLTGFVATIAGSATAEPVITKTTGTGTTWMRIQGAENAAALEQRFNPTGSHEEMRISVVSGEDYPSTVQYIVAEGNDRTAARALARVVAQTRATLDDVVEGRLSKDYSNVIRLSKDARTRAIQNFMTEHDLESAGAMEGDHATDYLVRVRELSKEAESSRIAGTNVYAFYSGVADPSESKHGVMMFRGPIAGHSLVSAREHSVAGKPSRAFSNATPERPFSMFATDTGRFVAGSARAADRHRDTNDRVREAHASRVRWAGKVTSYNPSSLLVFHAPNDVHLIGALETLGVKPSSSISQQHLNMVVCELPGLVTNHMSLGQLVDVANNSSERSLPVQTAAFLRMLAQWDDAPAQRIASLFASQEGNSVDVDTDVLKAMRKSELADM